MDNVGIKLIDYKVTPLQACLLDWMREHPYSTIEKLTIHEGVPLELKVNNELGTETIRFDRIAKDKGLI